MCMKNFARIAHVDIPNFHFQRAGARIDRVVENFKLFNHSHFVEGFWEQESLTDAQVEEIKKGTFLDCWPPRPVPKQGLLDEILGLGLTLNLP